MLTAIWVFLLSTEPYRTIELSDSVISCYEYDDRIYSLEVTNEATDKLLNGEPVTITPYEGGQPLCDRDVYVCSSCHASITR